LGCELHPPRPVRGRLDTIQFAHFTPGGDRGHRDLQPRGGGLRTIPAVSALALEAGRGALRAPTGDVVGVADPVHLTGGEAPTLATAEARRIQTVGNLAISVGRR